MVQGQSCLMNYAARICLPAFSCHPMSHVVFDTKSYLFGQQQGSILGAPHTSEDQITDRKKLLYLTQVAFI